MEERRLRAFENRELRKIFGPKKPVVTADFGSVQNGDLRDLLLLIKYYPSDQINMNETGRACRKYREKNRSIETSGGKA
jgi:hypothetical protein